MKGRGLSCHQKEWNEDQRLEGASFMPRLQQARLSQIQPEISSKERVDIEGDPGEQTRAGMNDW